MHIFQCFTRIYARKNIFLSCEYAWLFTIINIHSLCNNKNNISKSPKNWYKNLVYILLRSLTDNICLCYSICNVMISAMFMLYMSYMFYILECIYVVVFYVCLVIVIYSFFLIVYGRNIIKIWIEIENPYNRF